MEIPDTERLSEQAMKEWKGKNSELLLLLIIPLILTLRTEIIETGKGTGIGTGKGTEIGRRALVVPVHQVLRQVLLPSTEEIGMVSRIDDRAGDRLSSQVIGAKVFFALGLMPEWNCL